MYQLSYEVKSVQVGNISELSLCEGEHKNYHILENIDIEGTRLSSKISPTRTDLIS